MIFYCIGKNLSAFIGWLFGRWTVIGRENVPKTGGVLVCANHVSYIDPPIVGGACPRPVHFMAKIELFRIPLLGTFIKYARAFPVRRGTADRQALKTAMKHLAKGNVVGMFPEGQRNFTSELLPAEAGASMIALRSRATVIPCALVNTEVLLKPHSFLLRFTKIRVVFGKPVELDDLYEKGGREAMDEAGQRIMAAIGKLLEEER